MKLRHAVHVVAVRSLVIDFTFTMGTNDTANVLYLPRMNNSGTIPPQAYTPDEKKTFGASPLSSSPAPCMHILHYTPHHLFP